MIITISAKSKVNVTVTPSLPIYFEEKIYKGEKGDTGLQGLQGLKGDTGANGVGIPIGGTAGQILTKLDSTDYNTIWQDNYADWTSIVKYTVKNNGTVLISKGTPVYSTGSNGTNILVGKASNATEASSSKTIGLMQSDIATTGSTSTGFVVTEGLLGGLNTAGTTAGDPVWLGINGSLIYGLTNKPYAPSHLVFIGIVTKVSAGNGEIFIKVQNGFELREIHDVDLITTTPINGHLLGFDGTLWVNKTIATWLGFTPVTNVRTIATTLPLQGGGDLSANRTLSILQASISQDGFLGQTDWTTFNSKFNLPSLTSGSVLFSNGSTIAQDNSNFYWDNVNKRLGIGTSTFVGSIKLAVNGQIGGPTYSSTYLDVSGAIPELRGNSGIGYYSSAGNHTFYGGSSVEYMRLTTAGNLGIGTNSPNNKLDILSTVADAANFQTSVVNGATAIYVGSYGNQTRVAIGATYAGVGYIGTTNNYPFTFRVNASEKMRIDTSGNVGIGEISPLTTLDIRTSANTTITPLASVPNVATTVLIGNTGTNGVLAIGHNNTGQAWLQGRSRLAGAAAEDILINPLGGNVGIGTTTPSAKLHIAAPGALSTDIALRVRNSADSLNLMFVNGLAQTAIGQGTATLTNMLTVQDVYSTSVAIELRSDQNPRVGSTFNTSRILSGYSSSTESFLDLQYAGGAYPYTYTTGLRLNSLGNIGIGTTAPTAKLDILDTVLAGSGALAGSVLNIAQTWNTTGVPTAILLNVTDTASNGYSKLFDFQVGGLSQLMLFKDGRLNLKTGGTLSTSGNNLNFRTNLAGGSGYNMDLASYNNFNTSSGAQGFASLGGAVAYPLGSAVFKGINLTYTINNSGVQTGTATGIFLNATETALNGMTHNLMDLQVGGVSKAKITNLGSLILAQDVRSPYFQANGGTSGVGYYFNTFAWIKSSAIGNILLQDENQTSFNRLQLGGTTSSFPSIKRNGAAIDFRLADDSGYAGIIYKTLLNSPTVTAGAVTFDCNLADIFAITLVTATPTAITLSNARAGSYVVNLKQPAGGSATVTWATTIVWAGGTAPTLTTTANYLDIVTLIYDGTTWRGTATLNFSS